MYPCSSTICGFFDYCLQALQVFIRLSAMLVGNHVCAIKNGCQNKSVPGYDYIHYIYAHYVLAQLPTYM